MVTKKKTKETVSAKEASDKSMDEAKKQQALKLLHIAKIYEDSIEPNIVLLFRRIEELIAASQLPLTHVNMILDLLKLELLNMADDAYVKRGAEKLMKGRRMVNRIG